MAVTTYTVLDGEILSENRNGTQRQYVPDPQGNTIALLDTSTAIVKEFSYWSYGGLKSGDAEATKYRFGGTYGGRSQWDGGVYFRNRVVDPEDGRWLTVDPLWPTQKAFGFCDSSPSSWTDPFGLQRDVIGTRSQVFGNLHAYNCSPALRNMFKTICSMFRHVTNQQQFLINNCISRSSRRIRTNGHQCGQLSDNRAKCLKNFCSGSGGDIFCDPYLPSAGRAQGCLPWDADQDTPHGDVFVAPGLIGSNFAGGFLGEAASGYLVFMHELGHVCGITHGCEKCFGNIDAMKQCNDIFSCCSYEVLFNGGDGHRCWQRII